MDTHKNMVIAKNQIITPKVASLEYNSQIWNSQPPQYDITFKNGETYSYNCSNVKWLKDPEILNPSLYRFSHNGKELSNIKNVYCFSNKSTHYLHICFENGSEKSYEKSSLKIETSSINNTASKDVLEYLKQVSSVDGLRSDDGTGLMSKQYAKIQFLSFDNALSAYLNPQICTNKKLDNSVPIFPFGYNASQFKAVKSALDNKISVIEGPPGTGKTQTILNIIANLLIQGKTVQVVSNNNSATANILEKLSSPKYNMGFLVAFLGNTDNKKNFIDDQSGKYPDISSWDNSNFKSDTFFEDISQLSQELNDIFQKQEQLAIVKQEYQAIETEIRHFNQYSKEIYKELYNIEILKKLNLAQVIKFWEECEKVSEAKQKLSFFFKLKSWLFYGISDWNFLSEDIRKIVTSIQSLFYTLKYEEITSEISNLENELKKRDAQKMIDNFIEISMKYLKGVLFKKYGKSENRTIFILSDLWKTPFKVQREYPITLSTTFSSRSSISKEAEFDYLIMDEASQVDVTTGALALSCAKNAVIVGDTKQLPNVIPEQLKEKLKPIFDCFKINNGYNYTENSFLKSICKIIPYIPTTLLREHYRCHPKIINFCNQKFYNNNLIIMTKDNGEKNVISVIKTNIGNHVRDHINQRQIDVISQEILPVLPCKAGEIGIIAPYNKQVDTIRKVIGDANIDVATVHKFQGREKDAIILSTVDDKISNFTDDPYLLNVAVSRAKNRLCLVVSGNKQPKESNIGDLIDYIEYNSFSITESNIYSVFDYLYSQYTEIRIQHLKNHTKISEFDSENLMYALIADILKSSEYSTLRVICHQPLNMLIRNPKLLNDDEYKYAMNHATHLDFLIYNCISKKPVLAIEVDGFRYHKQGTVQAKRDKMKNRILELYEIPLLRFATNASGEKEKIIAKLTEIFKVI